MNFPMWMSRRSSADVDWSVALAPLAPQSLTVYLDTTNNCNLRCRMCHFSLPQVSQRVARFLSLEAFDRIGAEVFPLARTLYLSASCEPLTHPRFADILRRPSLARVPDRRLLTNAMLLTREITDAIVDSGVDRLEVSVDGACAKTYEYVRRGARFDRLLEKLELVSERKRALHSETPHVQLNVTLMRSNLDELPAFADLARDHGAELVACRHVMPYEGLGLADEALDTTPREANERFHEFLERAARLGVHVTAFPDFFSVDGRAWLPPLPPEPPSDTPRFVGAGPFGRIDVPGERRVKSDGWLHLAGWVLDEARVDRVEIVREALRGETSQRTSDVHASCGSARAYIAVGDAKILNGARPDVSRAYAHVPFAYRAGWRFDGALEVPNAERSASLRVHAVAHSSDGRSCCIGTRDVGLDVRRTAPPRPFCSKPFASIYIDAECRIVPSPDCQNWAPLGVWSESNGLATIWHGDGFGVVRRRILSGDAPESCRRCPDFINRRVDDPAFFRERDVLSGGP